MKKSLIALSIVLSLVLCLGCSGLPTVQSENPEPPAVTFIDFMKPFYAYHDSNGKLSLASDYSFPDDFLIVVPGVFRNEGINITSLMDDKIGLSVTLYDGSGQITNKSESKEYNVRELSVVSEWPDMEIGISDFLNGNYRLNHKQKKLIGAVLKGQKHKVILKVQYGGYGCSTNKDADGEYFEHIELRLYIKEVISVEPITEECTK